MEYFTSPSLPSGLIVIYLASISPRRRELLDQIRLAYQQIIVTIDETPYLQELPTAYVERMALTKAQMGYSTIQSVDKSSDIIVLGADTAVVHRDVIYGKPCDSDDAINTLKQLSGQCHQVMTAVAVVTATQQYVTLNISQVTFRLLTDTEIRNYVATKEPLDKAGSYAIQGLASLFIKHMEGSYSSIMGLPLYETANLLNKVGIDIAQGWIHAT